MDSPIAPPPTSESRLVPNYSSDRPQYKLYQPRAVTLATFLGSPVAGAIVLAINYHRLGKSNAAIGAIAAGVSSIIASVAFGWSIPNQRLNAMFALCQLLAFGMAAGILQGGAVKRHKRLGGKIASLWAAAGIGVISLVVFGSAIFALVLVTEGLPRKSTTIFARTATRPTSIIIGTRDKVSFKGGATANDARALGKALQDLGYFKDRGLSVIVSKDVSGRTISFVVHEGVWDDRQLCEDFRIIGRAVAPSIGPLPIKVRLVDTQLVTKKEIDVK